MTMALEVSNSSRCLMPALSHEILAKHFYLDALDLYRRFNRHWEDQPRLSSRVKSFVDLLMACECILKAQCLLAKRNLSVTDAYLEVKKHGHDIGKLADAARLTFKLEAHELVRQNFGALSVNLRYSADAHEYFFPFNGPPRVGRRSYSETLGNSIWIRDSVEAVESLIQWGKVTFGGEVDARIEDILRGEAEVALAVQVRPKPTKRPRIDA